jgi:hypothetical protein
VGARDGWTQSARASLFFSFTSNPSPKKLKKLVFYKKNASFLSKLRRRKKKTPRFCRNYAGEERKKKNYVETTPEGKKKKTPHFCRNYAEEKKNAWFLLKLRRRKEKKNLRCFRHRKLC